MHRVKPIAQRLSDLSISAIWIAAAAASIFIVKGTRIGPTILVISDKMGWGVHLGDFLAVIPPVLALWGTGEILSNKLDVL